MSLDDVIIHDKYRYPVEIWDEKRCKKEANYTASDGMGTKYPFKGYLGQYGFGSERYNGCAMIDGELYSHVIKPLPVIHEDYVIVYVLSWGYRIRRKDDDVYYAGTEVEPF